MAHYISRAFEKVPIDSVASPPASPRKTAEPDPDKGWPRKPRLADYEWDWAVISHCVGGSDRPHVPSDLQAAKSYFMARRYLAGIGANFSWAKEVVLMRTKVIATQKFTHSERGHHNKYATQPVTKDWEIVLQAQFVTGLYADVTLSFKPENVSVLPDTLINREYRIPHYYCESLNLKNPTPTFQPNELVPTLRNIAGTANSYLSTHSTAYMNQLKQFALMRFVKLRNEGIPQTLYAG